MFLKERKASTDPRVRSLLQKAARRGSVGIVNLACDRLEHVGDTTWLRSRAVIITFEECWPLADALSLNREPSSKRNAILNVARAAKQKDAAGLGALAYAYSENDDSMLGSVPSERTLRIVAEALRRPDPFFEWVHTQSGSERSRKIISAAKKYLPAATWAWDKTCILAGAMLSTLAEPPQVELVEPSVDEFPFWVALDKHTPQGKPVLSEVATLVGASYRQLIWAGFYCESARVNRLLPSPWFEAEKAWRLRRANLTTDAADDLWARSRNLIRDRLSGEAAQLQNLLGGSSEQQGGKPLSQGDLFNG